MESGALSSAAAAPLFREPGGDDLSLLARLGASKVRRMGGDGGRVAPAADPPTARR